MVCQEVFNLMGWNQNEINFDNIKPESWKSLTGNMMALPSIGLVLVALLGNIPFNEMTDFTKPRAAAASSSRPP